MSCSFTDSITHIVINKMNALFITIITQSLGHGRMRCFKLSRASWSS